MLREIFENQKQEEEKCIEINERKENNENCPNNNTSKLNYSTNIDSQNLPTRTTEKKSVKQNLSPPVVELNLLTSNETKENNEKQKEEEENLETENINNNIEIVKAHNLSFYGTFCLQKNEGQKKESNNSIIRNIKSKSKSKSKGKISSSNNSKPRSSNISINQPSNKLERLSSFINQIKDEKVCNQKQDIENLEKQKSQLETKISFFSSNICQLKKKVENASSQEIIIQRDTTKLFSEKEKNLSDSNYLKNEIKKCLFENEKMKNDLVKTNEETKEVIEACTELENELYEMKEEIKELNNFNSNLKSDIDGLKNELRFYKMKCEMFYERINKVEKKSNAFVDSVGELIKISKKSNKRKKSKKK